MAIEIPSLRDLSRRTTADVQSALPSANPTLRETLLQALVFATTGRTWEAWQQLRLLEREIFPDTASDATTQARWGALKGLAPLLASRATGYVSFTQQEDEVASPIPLGTLLQSGTGNLYRTLEAGTMQAVSLSITSMTRLGSTVSVQTSADHSFTGISAVTITGANEADYNGTHDIVATGTDSFSFEIATTPESPATGVMTASAMLATGLVESDGVGQAQNLASDAVLILTSSIAEVEDEARVAFSTVSGGSDDETTEEFRARYLHDYANPVAQFNQAAIERAALAVPGVTDVFVHPITPNIGDVTVYFLRGQDADIIPSPREVADVRAAILDIFPAHSNPEDLYVLAPTPHLVNFTFTELEPASKSLQDQIIADLKALFRSQTSVGQVLEEDTFRAAIFNTVTLDGQERVTRFELSGPVGDITPAAGSIPTLGNLSFAL